MLKFGERRSDLLDYKRKGAMNKRIMCSRKSGIRLLKTEYSVVVVINL